MRRSERERRLAHAEPTRQDNRPFLREDRRDELLKPILAADHFRVGRQRRRDDGLRRELGEIGGKIGVIAEPDGRYSCGPWVGIAVGDENEVFVAKAGETLVHPVEQPADIVIRQPRSRAADEHERKVEPRRSLYELRQFGRGDPVVVVLRKDDRVRSIEIAVDVPHRRTLALQRLDHPQVVGPVCAIPVERLRNQVIVVCRRDLILCRSDLLNCFENCGLDDRQRAKLVDEEGAIGTVDRRQLLLDGVRGTEPIRNFL